MRTPTQRSGRNLGAALLSAALGVGGALVVAYSTRHGAWAWSDSVEYVVSARNLCAGRGLGLAQASGDFVPLSRFPPLYPLTLSAGCFAGVDPLTLARWADVALFGLLVLLAGILALHLTSSPWLALLAGGLTLTSPVLLDLFSGAMSEPLFLVLFAAALGVLVRHLQHRRPAVLVAAAILAGLAAVTRYVGVAVPLSGVAGLSLLGRGRLRHRLGDALLFAAVSLLPLGAWLVLLALGAARTHARELTLPIDNVWQTLRPFRYGFVEGLWSMLPLPAGMYEIAHRLKAVGLALGFLAAAGAAGWMVIRIDRSATADVTQSRDRLRLVALFGLSWAVYVSCTLLAYLFTQPTPDINARMLSPILVPGILFTLGLASLLPAAWPTAGPLRAIPLVLGLAAVVGFAVPAARVVSDLHARGAGYTSPGWTSSAAIAAVRRLPADVPLISNETAAILLLTGRPAYDLPELMDLRPVAVSLRFGDDPTDPIQRVFREHGAALVLFSSILNDLEGLYPGQAASRLASMTSGLTMGARLADGTLYFYPTPGPASR